MYKEEINEPFDSDADVVSVSLRLDLDRGILTAMDSLGQRRLGVLATDISGSFCWMVDIENAYREINWVEIQASHAAPWSPDESLAEASEVLALNAARYLSSELFGLNNSDDGLITREEEPALWAQLDASWSSAEETEDSESVGSNECGWGDRPGVNLSYRLAALAFAKVTHERLGLQSPVR